MDGFYAKPGGGFEYVPKQGGAFANQGWKFVPWDAAPEAWRASVGKSRGQGGFQFAGGSQPGEPNSQRTGPLDMRAGAAPNALTSVAQSTPDTGFMGNPPGRDTLSKLTGFLKGNWKDILPAVGSGLAYLDQRGRQNKADEMSDEGLRFAQREWSDRAPLREGFMGMAGAAPTEGPDLSATFADTGNPYFRALPRAASPAAGFSRLPGPWNPGEKYPRSR